MLRARLIPVVLLRNGVVVQSKGFKRYQALGNPTTIVGRLSNWYSDELIYLDISRENNYDLGRDDLNYDNIKDKYEILDKVSKNCFMPLTYGGGITNIKQVYNILNLGADKISINTQAFKEPALIENCAKEFGSQCVVISIDVKSNQTGGWEVYIQGGRVATGSDPISWAREAQERGAGEILINSIDRDGSGLGYDTELISSITNNVKIPVIALGGVGQYEQFADGLKAGASAVAAANIFSYTENSVFNAKKLLYDAGFPLRKPYIQSIVGI